MLKNILVELCVKKKLSFAVRYFMTGIAYYKINPISR